MGCRNIGYSFVLNGSVSNILAAKGTFFAGLNEIEYIIIIGHSLSPVDGDYFFEIVSRIPNIKDVRWYFGCHGLMGVNLLLIQLK